MVRRMQAKGIVVDVAHASDQVAASPGVVVTVSTAEYVWPPIVAGVTGRLCATSQRWRRSRSSCRTPVCKVLAPATVICQTSCCTLLLTRAASSALRSSRRCVLLPPPVSHALCGPACLTWWRCALQAVCGLTVDDIVKAVVYAVGVVGVDHVALGSDFDGTVKVPIDTSHLAALTHALLEVRHSSGVAKPPPSNPLLTPRYTGRAQQGRYRGHLKRQCTACVACMSAGSVITPTRVVPHNKQHSKCRPNPHPFVFLACGQVHSHLSRTAHC